MLDPAASAKSAVLCTHNHAVDDLNAKALDMLNKAHAQQHQQPLHIHTLAAETIVKDDRDANILDGMQPNHDFLKLCSESGLPPHDLQLANGAAAMIIRNLSPHPHQWYPRRHLQRQ